MRLKTVEMEKPLDVKIKNAEMSIMAKKAVTLQGIHFSIHTPTEERLTFQIDNLTPQTFRKLAMDFEDWSAVINSKYKDKSTRGGRSWKGRGHRRQTQIDDSLEATTTRIRVIRASPFPSAFSNTLSSIRRELYIALRRHCIVLEGDKHGGYRQNIYVLPYANAPSLMASIAEQNAVIEELNTKIEEFRKSAEWQDFRHILKRNHANIDDFGMHQWHIERITFDATPLMLEPGAVMKMVKTARSNIATELKEYEEQGMEQLNRELERRRAEMVTQALNALERDIKVEVAAIVAGMKRDPERAQVALERLRNKVVSIGLDALATSVVDPLSELIENPERLEELFGTRKVADLPSKVDGKMRSFIDSL